VAKIWPFRTSDDPRKRANTTLKEAERSTDPTVLGAIAKTAPLIHVAEVAVARLTDEAILADVAKNATHFLVAEAAVAKVTNQGLLKEIAVTTKFRRVTEIALEKLSDPQALEEIAAADHHSSPWFIAALTSAIARLTDQDALARLALSAADLEVRTTAVELVTDQQALTMIGGKSSDLAVRLAVGKKLQDKALLREMALQPDATMEVRLAAAKQLQDKALLKEVALQPDAAIEVRLVAAQRLGDSAILQQLATQKEQARLAEIALREIDWSSRYWTPERIREKENAIKLLTDQAVLTRIAEHDSDSDARELAVPRLTDEAARARIAEHDARESVRMVAVNTLTDPAALTRIAEHESDLSVGRAAVARIHDQRALEHIALNAAEESTRAAAADRVKDRAFLVEIAKRNDLGIYGLKIIDGVAHNTVFERLTDKSKYDVILYWAQHNRVISRSSIDFVRQRDEKGLVVIVSSASPHYDDFRLYADTLRMITDPTDLAAIAIGAANADLREMAVDRLTDQSALIDVVTRANSESPRHRAAAKLNMMMNTREFCRLLFDVALDKLDSTMLGDSVTPYSREDIVNSIKHLDDQRSLVFIAEHSLDETVRDTALRRVDSAWERTRIGHIIDCRAGKHDLVHYEGEATEDQKVVSSWSYDQCRHCGKRV